MKKLFVILSIFVLQNISYATIKHFKIHEKDLVGFIGVFDESMTELVTVFMDVPGNLANYDSFSNIYQGNEKFTAFKYSTGPKDILRIPNTNKIFINLYSLFGSVCTPSLITLWDKGNDSLVLNMVYNPIYGHPTFENIYTLNETEYLILGESESGDGDNNSGGCIWLAYFKLPDTFKIIIKECYENVMDSFQESLIYKIDIKKMRISFKKTHIDLVNNGKKNIKHSKYDIKKQINEKK